MRKVPQFCEMHRGYTTKVLFTVVLGGALEGQRRHACGRCLAGLTGRHRLMDDYGNFVVRTVLPKPCSKALGGTWYELANPSFAQVETLVMQGYLVVRGNLEV